MFSRMRKARLVGSGLAVTAIATLAATIAIAGADAGDMGVHGTFTATPTFSGPDCPSPVDLCATGAFRGGIHGPATAVAQSVAPTTEPGVIVAVVDLVIHDPRGDLRCTEIVVLDATPGGDNEEGWICKITGGTGRFANASGHLEAYGSQPPGEDASGRYAGQVTLR